ncbi:hypothetical protein [Methylobacterium radiotolerans]|uniref:hypothetical protein n=1 Tax=Methylobacterium radiotolerans TaxID=31998 RepID=UPI001F491428|nr:hypothetical protein [Methylobacterium radiotolerans]UIY45627.1 hypothetical protein LZ599_31185 [Methylobacterium radiotolerans]
MTYTIEQLAPGSYDVLRDGALIASLVRNVHRNGPADTWSAELLDEMPNAQRPEPFTNQRHVFKSRSAALAWLGIQETDTEPTG